MTKKKRTILFASMSILFLFIAPFLIMYSQGYRFDTKKLQFIETGGLYIKAIPEEVNLSINQQYINKTSFFTRDILIQNLIPDSYKIKIEKEGYYPWEKNLDIKQKKVAEAKYIIMFKTENSFNLISNNISSFYPNKDQFLLLTNLNEILLYDNQKKTEKILNTSQTPNNIESVKFTSEEEVIIKTKTGLYYLLDIDNKDIELIRSFNIDTKNINTINNNLIYQFNNSIYEIDPKEDYPKLLSREKIDSFTINNDSIIAIRENEVLKIHDLTKPEELLYYFNDYKENSEYQIISIEEELFIIEDDQTLYILNKENKIFEEKIVANSKLEYTSFFNKIIFYTKNDIWLMLLKRYESPFFRDAYSVIHISSFEEKIDNVKWLNGDYFIFTLDNNVHISEIDNRDKLNMFNLKEGETTNIFFNGNSKKLFILNNDNFIELEKIIP